ncbi:MAG: methionyl-tRNA formyltransferase [Methylobacterium mesophilicum]|nr:methionyl-tRNA formyltransferase [Methylobacterium mesophilicum]
MGTPDFSVPTLRALHEAGHLIAAVYSQPPRPAGRRGLELVPSPVAREAERLGIPVQTPVSLKSAEEQQAFQALEIDVAVVVAYGLILPPAVLEAPRFGCLNGHASLLPRWRGAAPIQRAIMAGDGETGTMVMQMERGLDTGPVAMTTRLAIGAEETAGELHDRLSAATASLMTEAIGGLEGLSFTPQPEEGVCYAHKIDKSETRIDWRLPAREVHDRIRGLAPFPGAWTEGQGERVKLLRSTLGEGEGEPGTILDGDLSVACGNGAVRLVEVQRAGGKPVAAQEFLRGARLGAGDRLG